MLKNLFGSGSNVDWSNKTRNEKYEALKKAIDSNNISEFKNLIKNGVDINTTEEYTDENVIVYYIKNCNELEIDSSKLLRFIIESGIKLNHVGNKRTEQMSGLHYAVLSKSKNITTTLVENGADIELQDKNGNTPLWKGVMNYRGDSNVKEILEYLLNNGASLDTISW